MAALKLALLVSAMFGLCRAFPSGAPSSACSTMSPKHGFRTTPQDHSQNPAHYAISIDGNMDTYRPGQTFELSLHSTDNTVFRGFLLEARSISGNPSGPVGSFQNDHKGTKAICDEKALTHHRTWRVRGDKFRATWVAPDADIGEVVFVMTVVKSYSVFWKNVRSVVLNPYRPPTAAPEPVKAVSQEPVNVIPDLSMCEASILTPLPEERPHVAILCDADAQCPCGWFCCPSCVDKVCVGYAICRQPMETEDKGDDDETAKSSEVLEHIQVQQSPPTNNRRNQEYAYSGTRW